MIVDRDNERVIFETQDRHFVERFGEKDASSMVLDYAFFSDLPFIFDVYQLASVLDLSCRDLYILTNHCDSQYQHFQIKKDDGKFRHLYAPKSRLKGVQRKILREILAFYPISPYASAYHKGSTLYHNASPHCRKKNVLKMDIVDFFGSISFSMVYNNVFHRRYFPVAIGTMLTTLCCRNNELPQGSPTSPSISNIVMKFFDDVMGKWCEKKGISYTRYCDDISFSGDVNLYPAFQKAKGLLEYMGLEVNERKTRFITQNRCQKVTGIVVNEFPQTAKEYRRKLRQELYYFYKFGAEDVIRRNDMQRFIASDGTVLLEKYRSSLRSRVEYILQIDPDNKEFLKERQRLMDKSGLE